VRAEHSRDYELALESYERSVHCLLAAREHETSAAKVQIVELKMGEYGERARLIKLALARRRSSTDERKDERENAHEKENENEQREMNELFATSKGERLVDYFRCAADSVLAGPGKLYVAECNVYFASKRGAHVTIALDDIVHLEKAKTNFVLPALLVRTVDGDEHVFTAFASRDSSHAVIDSLWRRRREARHNSNGASASPSSSSAKPLHAKPKVAAAAPAEPSVDEHGGDVLDEERQLFSVRFGSIDAELCAHHCCALKGTQDEATLYMTKRQLCYYGERQAPGESAASSSSSSATASRIVVPWCDVISIAKEQRFFGPNYLIVSTDGLHGQLVFARFVSLDDAHADAVRLHDDYRRRPIVFGIELRALLVRERRLESGVPAIVARCIGFLSADGERLRTEGLFRVAPSRLSLRALCERVDDGYALDDGAAAADCSAHLVAALLKRYFGQMPEPLFTFDLYDLLVAIAALPDEALRVVKLKAIVGALPAERRRLAARLFRFLAVVASHASHNKMSASNLAAIFSPLIMRFNGALSAEILDETKSLLCCIELMIGEHEQIFAER
jgi:RhoGAP domain/GRAM domain